MVVNKDTSPLDREQDLVHVAILLTIAFGIGVYLITTTVLIAKDGVFYIEQAQKFARDPISVIRFGGYPFGYSFLIFLSHKFFALFGDSLSVTTWIYSAQSVTLLCRMLSLIPLYFMGKFFVGDKKAFWGGLILLMLPYPAKIGCDTLRDWPHLLFLITGFLFLLLGAKQGKWWMFGLSGLAAGFGYMIRPECAQLVIYGVLWVLVSLLQRKRNMSRAKLVAALLIILVGFAVPVGPYIKARGKILSGKVKTLIKFSSQTRLEKIQEQNVDSHNHVYTAASLPGDIAKAFGKLVERISEHLMYFFVPALLIGIYFRFYEQSVARDMERFFVSAFVMFNVIMLVLLYCSRGYMSRRHCLPLIVLSIFYVPVGLQVLGEWLRNRFSKGRLETDQNPQLWFFALLMVGAAICMPKLLRPMRVEKQYYRAAARWLQENAVSEDIVAVSDRRISFYAERIGMVPEKGEFPQEAKYFVDIVKSEDEKLKLGRNIQEEVWMWEDRGKRLVIYKRI